MATHHKGTPEEKQALDAFIKLNRAAESVSNRVNRHLLNEGLTVSQFGILEALYHLGPLCQKELGGKLLKSGGNVTMVVDHLEAHGQVRRVRSDEDRRKIVVHLTPEGHDLTAKLFPVHAKEVTREMSVLSPSEQDALSRLCRKLGLGSFRED